MPPPIKITIPKPCHENWDEMLPAAKGRHCLSCQKTVVDFTSMSDGDILKQLKKAAAHRPGAELCGRFMPDQLNRQLVPPPIRAGFHWRGWQWVIAGVLLTSDVTTPSKRPPMQEQRMPGVKTVTTQDIILGGMSFTARTYVENPVVSDTAEMGTPSVLVGDIAVLPPDSLPNPPDSLMRPPCIHRPDSLDDKLGKFYTGGIEVVDADSTKISSDSTVTSSDSTFGSKTPTEPSVTTPPIESLRIYPNPIALGSTYHIQFPAEGEYQLTLFNINGALLQQKTITIIGINQTNELQLPTGLTPGIYILRATRNNRPQPYTTKILIR